MLTTCVQAVHCTCHVYMLTTCVQAVQCTRRVYMLTTCVQAVHCTPCVHVDDVCTGSALYTPCVQRLACACYAPYRDYVAQFGDYEDTTLTDALDAIPMVSLATYVKSEVSSDCVSILINYCNTAKISYIIIDISASGSRSFYQ